MWVSSLREGGPKGSNPVSKGIIEINLEGNGLDDTFAKDLAYFLKYDTWLRSLNLKNNNITDEGVKELLDLLEKNISLFTLDLRGNPGFNVKISQQFLSKLIFNMQNFKNNKRIERIEEIKEEEKSLSEFYKNSDNLNLPSHNSF